MCLIICQQSLLPRQSPEDKLIEGHTSVKSCNFNKVLAISDISLHPFICVICFEEEWLLQLLGTSEVLVGTIPSAITFPSISQSDNLKSSQNFENLSIISSVQFNLFHMDIDVTK